MYYMSGLDVLYVKVLKIMDWTGCMICQSTKCIIWIWTGCMICQSIKDNGLDWMYDM